MWWHFFICLSFLALSVYIFLLQFYCPCNSSFCNPVIFLPQYIIFSFHFSYDFLFFLNKINSFGFYRRWFPELCFSTDTVPLCFQDDMLTLLLPYFFCKSHAWKQSTQNQRFNRKEMWEITHFWSPNLSAWVMF